MSESTCNRYMRLFRHKDKTVTMTDLQDAYKQIEQIEYQEKRQNPQYAEFDRLIRAVLVSCFPVTCIL